MTFILTSFLTLFCGLVDIVFLSAGTDANPNRIDRFLMAKARRMIPIGVTDDQRLFWQPVLRQFVMSLSDQQFLTGLAILTAGLWKHCSISVYHFSLIFDMGWFSSTTHLIAISTLVPFYRRDKIRRNLRVLLMVIMMALLTTYAVMRSHRYWIYYWTTPAQCLFDDLRGNISAAYIATYVFPTAIAYGATVIFLYEEASSVCRRWLVTVPTAILDKGVENLRRRADSGHGPSSLWLNALLLIRVTFVGVWTLSSSWCLSYLVFWTWFGIGIQVIMIDRRLASSRTIGDENQLSFGQFVPIFLLGSTALVFRESYYGRF